MENTWDHYGQWGAVLIWILLYSLLLLFVPFYKKSSKKPASAYLAFVIAFALEMFGIPFSLYFIGWLFGFTLPEGVLWGHTLVNYIGNWGMYVGAIMMIIGVIIVIFGWKAIHKYYWSKESGEGKLVKKGIYSHIRHPQYTGFFLVTLGMIAEWATLPLLIMWPILFVLYYRLAKKEEKDMINEFGEEYIAYKNKTGMFLPKLTIKKINR